jgi:peptidoglycan/LPS O-acetylase OafA/YrhL
MIPFAGVVRERRVFGIYRFILPMLVVMGHLWTQGWLGTHAVFAFYILSGFLMTLIMNKRYGYTPRGVSLFAINRFLRIFPIYYAACALTLALIVWQPTQLAAFHDAMRLSNDWLGWVRDATIIGVRIDTLSRLVPPAWALHTELVFYGLIALGLGRGPRIALAWLIVSLGLVVWNYASGRWIPEAYFTVLGGSLPFAIGCCLFHFRTRIEMWLPFRRAMVFGAIALWLINGGARLVLLAPAFQPHVLRVLGLDAYASVIGDGVDIITFYVSLALNVVLVQQLIQYRPSSATLKNWDKRLGDLSYPVYLLHWQCGFIASQLFGVEPRTAWVLLSSIPILLVVSYVVNILLSDPLEHLRTSVKKQLPDKGEHPADEALPGRGAALGDTGSPELRKG